MRYRHLLQKPFGAAPHIGGGPALIQVSRHGDIFKQGQVTYQVHLLEYKTELRITELRKLAFPQLHDIPAAVDNLSPRGSVHTAQSIQQSGFP